MTSLPTTRLLKAADVADRWQCTPKHVYALARDGSVPFVQIGRYVRFRPEDIEEWERNGGGDTNA